MWCMIYTVYIVQLLVQVNAKPGVHIVHCTLPGFIQRIQQQQEERNGQGGDIDLQFSDAFTNKSDFCSAMLSVNVQSYD